MKTKIILEMGCNHQGDIETAKRMIDDAKSLGVYGVKFQKRDIESIPENVKTKKRSLKNSFGPTYYEHRKALEFSIKEIEFLKYYAHNRGLFFICSAFDEKSFYDLLEIGCEIKLPSQLFSNEIFYNLYKKYASKEIFYIWLSTGMHTINEIKRSPWMKENVFIMYCNSIYPFTIVNLNIINLNIIRKSMSDSERLGYSSHGLNGKDVFYSVLLGAKYVERHYTLDKNLKGSDHSTVSSDYLEMKKIINDVKLAEDILGEIKIKLLPEEKRFRKIYMGDKCL